MLPNGKGTLQKDGRTHICAAARFPTKCHSATKLRLKTCRRQTIAISSSTAVAAGGRLSRHQHDTKMLSMLQELRKPVPTLCGRRQQSSPCTAYQCRGSARWELADEAAHNMKPNTPSCAHLTPFFIYSSTPAMFEIQALALPHRRRGAS